MEHKFLNWIIEKENKKSSTAYNYCKALNRVSEHFSIYKNEKIDIYGINSLETIDQLIDLYGSNGKYSQFGDKGRKTNINAIKAYKRFLTNSPKMKEVSIISIKKENSKVKLSTTYSSSSHLLSNFEDKLKSEAQLMRMTYEVFYCLERSIRELVKLTMTEAYGNDWWSKVDSRVKENVKNNLEYELDTTHTKRSEQRIDYTTFGDLRKIINSNWDVFERQFKRSLNSVNEVMIDLNRIRVSIAHCTPLAQKEINRLEIRVDDWFGLLRD